MHIGNTLAAGLRALPDETQSFASTQGAWRFYQNEETTLACLAKPLLARVAQGVESDCEKYALIAHDWSHINYSKHHSKHDKLQMTHKTDVGYELQSALVLSDKTGSPIAPVVQNLATANGLLSTYRKNAQTLPRHLDELTERISWIEQLKLDKPVVHIIDREASSIAHLRAWTHAHWLIRTKSNSRVDFRGQSVLLSEIPAHLAFSDHGEVAIGAQKAQLWLAETEIVISRAAKPARKIKGKRRCIKGEPLRCRLVVSRLYSDQGHCLAEWYLLSNVNEVSLYRLARWYYWRWQIESFYKLLKSAGHHLEHWQQESAIAVAKRLLIASMACVFVWELSQKKDKKSVEFQHFLIRLSGRQMKRSKPITHSALLQGMWVFLSLTEVMGQFDSHQLRQWAKTFRPRE